MVGTLAVCGYHGPPHAHRPLDPTHPDHAPRIPIDPSLDLAAVLDRVRTLCLALPREPTLDELLEALR